MLLTDSGSIMYKVEAGCAYEIFCKDEKIIDFSNYPKDSKYQNNSNNLLVGKMKDETCGIPIKVLQD